MRKFCFPYGADAPPGRFECLDCGYVLALPDRSELPPCHKASGELRHTKRAWVRFRGTPTEDLSPYPRAQQHG
jgi:hypothetical protein